MSLPKEHFGIASERFDWAERAYEEENYHTAGHLYINAAIKFTDFLCQKYLGKVTTRKSHADTSFFKDLSKFLKDNSHEFKEAYSFLMAQKSIADYGVELSENTCKQIQRKTNKIKEIAEQHYNGQ